MFPIKKQNIKFNDSETGFLENYDTETEIPLLPHPGAFSKVRKNHQHEGIDLYCKKGEEIFSIEDGIIVKIKPFTGEHVGSDWWNNTWCVLVEGKTGVFNYGEIIPNPEIKEGMLIKEGTLIGHVETVLKKNKGRPMNMLHLELYKHGTLDAINEWPLNKEKPDHLLDPTEKLIELANLKENKKIRKLK